MWQPNSKQWKTIWITVATAGFFWLLEPLDYTSQNENTALFVIAIGALLIWRQQSQTTPPSKPQ